MNILFLSTIFPDTLNPARGTFNYELCCALQRLGVDVRVIAPQAWPEVMKQRLHDRSARATHGMQQHGLSAEYPTFWYPPKLGRSWYGSCYSWSIRQAVRKTLDNWTPDFVLSYWAHPDGAAGLHVARQLGIPCGVMIGGSDVLVLPKSAGRKQQVSRVLQQSDLILTVSEGLADTVIQLGGQPDHVTTLYQGVDPQRFQPGPKITARKWLGMDPERPLLLWVGRMVPIKNLDLLIAAAEIKANRGDDFVLCLLGDGPERERISQKIQQKELENIVSLVGAVGHEALPSWYQAADVTVLCSHSEGLPNVFRESLACGTPFVSTDVGSIAEIANPNVAMLVPPGDADAFAQAIDTVLYGSHQQQARSTHTRTWQDMAEELLDLIEQVQTHGHLK